MRIPPVKIPFSDADIDRLAERFKETLRSGFIAMGPHAAAFETAFSAFLGGPRCIGCGSGTQALELVCRALGVAGGSVAVPAATFMATAMAPVAAGARVILVDCDPLTLQMDPGDLERKMAPDTRAVILVHLGGSVSTEWGRIRETARAAGAAFVEDAAHAHGAEVDGRMAGTLGEAAAFSFFATKVLTTGEGGMVATSDPELAGRLLVLRQHGQLRPGSNVHEGFGLNYRPSEIHALLGLDVLSRAASILSARRLAALEYDRLLEGTPFRPLPAPPGQRPSYYKYIVFLPGGVPRGPFKERLFERHGYALAGEVYALPLDRQPFWASRPELLARPLEPLPGAAAGCAGHVCLPIWPGIDPADQRALVEAMVDTAAGFRGGTGRP
ncbi:MAG: DegT/DnrJ/EryC1/StrS family aminotransferase [Deltaproteobacteria bacterium]|jgi:dTDP-4-amino-4,6-dideoxygalactose transaminase|nr:DegT/DnrJ/EryC1/StrS family aminotransferase [Deltaproteobacteria bacterium]